MPTPLKSLARIKRALPKIISTFGTPFYIYDQQGILKRGDELKRAMYGVEGYRQYYAVKAWNNPANLRLQQSMGFGFDCSSPYEMDLVDDLGGRREFILTSNNSRPEWFDQCNSLGGILNLDDVSLIKKVREFPKLICFRLNPGKRKTGNSIIGNPVEAKYGIMWEQLVPAYREAMKRGATYFCLHTMVCSNCLDENYLVDTVKMLLDAIEEVELKLGIKFDFINMGGGFGIPYKPTDKPLNINRIGERIAELMDGYRRKHGYTPKLFTEMGRWMTGPFGVLVTRVINRKEIYQTHVGVDVGMNGLMRHGIYGAYHHIEVVGGSRRKTEVVNVVGQICENCDRLATQRCLPVTREGDTMLVQDVGAHGIVMVFRYNGTTAPAEFMLREDGMAEMIRRAETYTDLDATLRYQDLNIQAF
jgi:diaminopimelate decarboxylase